MKLISKLSLLLIVTALLTSCFGGKDHRQMIPKDAAFVISITPYEVVKTSGAEGNDKPSKLLKKYLDQMTLSKNAKEKLGDIIDNPRHSGIDLISPIVFFPINNENDKMAIAGAVDDADALTELINALASEAMCDKVNSLNDVNYTFIDDVVMMYDDDCFYLTDYNTNNSSKEVLEQIQMSFNREKENSILDSKAFSHLDKAEGCMQLLAQYKGFENMVKEYDATALDMIKAQFPAGVSLSDFGLIYDLQMNIGEFKLMGETFGVTEDAEDWIENIDLYGKIAGDFNHYLPADNWFYCATNIKGETLSRLLLPMLKNMPSNAVNMTEKAQMEKVSELLADVNGDVAMTFSGDFSTNSPEVRLYAQTNNAKWLNEVEAMNLPVEKKGEQNYSFTLPNLSGYPSYLNFGVKGGVSYALLSPNPQPLKKLDKYIDYGEGYNAYMRIDLTQLNKKELWRNAVNSYEARIANNIMNKFDYAEMYVQNNTSATLSIKMKDKDNYPLKGFIEDAMALANIFM